MTRARDLADLLTGGQTISTADNTAQITLTSTDTDSGHGPRLNMERNPSEAGADGDNLGQIFIQGYNDAGTPELIDYFQLFTEIADASDGTEDARQIHYVMTGGSQRSRIEHNATETVINEDSVDLDFRVESDNTTHALFVEGSSGNVGIGDDDPGRMLHIKALGTSTAEQAALLMENEVGTTGEIKQGPASDNAMIFTENGSERMRVNTSGAVLVGLTSPLFSQTIGLHTSSSSAGSTAHFNRSGDGGVVRIGSDATEEGSISVSGTTVSYNGGHLSRWSQATDGNRIDGLVKGTVMTNLDQMAVWHHEAQEATYYKSGDEKTPATDAYNEDNEQLNCMAVSSVEGDVNVAGVFVNWDDDAVFTADMNIAMTGDMVIRIAKDTTVERGNLLMSAGDGTAKPQGDGYVQDKTIAKVTSTTKSHTYDDGSYLVPCVLMAC